MGLYRRALLCSLLLLLCLVALAAAKSIVGTWDCVTNTADGEMKWVLVVKEEGGKLSGTATGDRGALDLIDPRLDGDVFSFKADVDGVTYTVKLRLSGDRISGTWSGNGDSGPMSGVRRGS